MCSRYSLTSPHDVVRAYFRYANEAVFPPRFNIAPTQPVAIVRIGVHQKRELALVRWGLIPAWSKDPKVSSTLINARGETAHEKPAFRGAMRHRRCLVPADGFYDWSGPKGRKMPHLYRPKHPGPIGFAGLWEGWLGSDGSEIETMAILTVAANETVASVHDRMPAILPPHHFDGWLDTRGVPVEEAVALLQPAPADFLDRLEVNPKLNNPRNEGAELQAPIIGPLL